MWSGGRETGTYGEAVLLFDTKDDWSDKKKKKLREKEATVTDGGGNSTTCSIGGRPRYFSEDEGIRRHLLSTRPSSGDGGGGGGGSDACAGANPSCELCGREMHMLAQVNAPLDEQDRTLYVFGCNRATCYNELFSGEEDAAKQTDSNGSSGKKERKSREDRFNVGGGGVIRCIRSQSNKDEMIDSSQKKYLPPSAKSTAIADTLPAWGGDENQSDGDAWGDTDDGDDGGWGGGDDSGWGGDNTNESLDDLEAMVAACEMKEGRAKNKKGKGQKNQKRQTTIKAMPLGSDGPGNKAAAPPGSAFARFELEMYNEPLGKKDARDYDDDDDDNIGAADENDDKVQTLLSKYLQEEEDADIVAAIQPGGRGSAGGGGAGGEKYERLPPDERAFLAFTDRTKRSPQQVVRYAYGGVPLWSVPAPKIHLQQQSKGKRGKDKNEKQSKVTFPVVPPCSCGSERSFELQLMPSILFALDVDRHALSSVNIVEKMPTAEDKIEWKMNNEFGNGGMNWGAVVVYSCAVSCESSREEFVVVQDSVDGRPMKRVVDNSKLQQGDNEVDCEGSNNDEMDS